MARDWPIKSFAELIANGELEIGDGYRAKNDELGGNGLIFLRAGQVTDTNISFVGVDRFLTTDDSRFGDKTSRDDDVVITTKGNSTGRVSQVTHDMPRFVYSPHLSYWRVSASGSVKQSFLRAWSRGPEFASQLDALSRATDMAPYLSLTDQRRLNVAIPPVGVQSWIGDFNDAIQARMELLRVTNATLEAIAQALFKSWFVDFDPVHAKADGRAPAGMDAATAALFPSEFEDSELGPIPKGSRVDAIGHAVRCVGGATPSTKNDEFWLDGIHHWATPKDLSGLSAPVLTTTERLITDAGVQRISSGLLPAGTLLMSSRAPIGYLAIAAMPTAINQGFIAMLPGGDLPPSYLLCWAKTNMDAIKQMANGSTFMEISKTAFRPMPVCVPSKSVVGAFESVFEPLFGRITANLKQSATLADLRDTLLPRLISGKLRLPDARQLAEADA